MAGILDQIANTLEDIVNPFSGGAGPLSKNYKKEKTKKAQVNLGGEASGSSQVGAGKSYDPDNLIRTYLPFLTPEQHDAIRQALKGEESKSGGDYHNALNQIIQQYGLQQYSPLGHAFGSPSSPGQLTGEQMQKLLGVTQAYQKPYLDALKNTEAQEGSFLKTLMPSLPKGYQDLVKTQFEGPGGVLNLDNQVASLLAAQNPAAIANAYSNLYAGSGTTGTTANNIFSSLAAQTPKTG